MLLRSSPAPSALNALMEAPGAPEGLASCRHPMLRQTMVQLREEALSDKHPLSMHLPGALEGHWDPQQRLSLRQQHQRCERLHPHQLLVQGVKEVDKAEVHLVMPASHHCCRAQEPPKAGLMPEGQTRHLP